MPGLSTADIAYVLSSYIITYRFVPLFMPLMEMLGLHGIDLNKTISDPPTYIPEALGLAVGVALVFSCVGKLISLRSTDFLVGVLAVTAATVLGMCDNLMNIRWRTKIAVSFAIFVLFSTWRTRDRIYVLGRFRVPLVLVWAYTLFFSVFCQNAVNIYAGVNGLEVGQSIIASAFLLAESLKQEFMPVRLPAGRCADGQKDHPVNDPSSDPTDGPAAFPAGEAPSEGRENTSPLVLQSTPQPRRFHFLLTDPISRLSLSSGRFISLVFLSASLALYHYNKYPSKVFVGDVYTFCAGAVYAVCASEMGLLPVAPLYYFMQLINFGLSLPQLLGVIPCPRHRLPTFDPDTGLLSGKPSNWNVINQYLRFVGPRSERRLVYELLGIQAVVSIVILVLPKTWLRCSPSPWDYAATRKAYSLWDRLSRAFAPPDRAPARSTLQQKPQDKFHAPNGKKIVVRGPKKAAPLKGEAHDAPATSSPPSAAGTSNRTPAPTPAKPTAKAVLPAAQRTVAEGSGPAE